MIKIGIFLFQTVKSFYEVITSFYTPLTQYILYIFYLGINISYLGLFKATEGFTLGCIYIHLDRRPKGVWNKCKYSESNTRRFILN